ncbi:MAG: Na+/H+ antiporter [Candidatus Eremiobacteraeota bacterium]|nr:Na+/H+ antiporter [Candidatus Eremiobacteraeota bacterium]
MQPPFLIFGLLIVTVAFAIVAKRLRLPYPIVFVIGGALLAFIPGLPEITVRPDLIFLVVLPPLLYAGGWTTDWRTFKQNRRPIALLAIGLVLVTTVVVAVCARGMTPELGWASAFALGAIVSPPDAVAAEAVFERFDIPRRIIAILSGEGLVNDATALVVYRFAVAAAVTGTFSLLWATVDFVAVAIGGIAIGLAVAAGIVTIGKLLDRSGLEDSLLDNLTLFIAPYAAYFSADGLHVSGVLSAVTAGIYVSRKSSEIYAPATRLTAWAIWSVLIFLLNALVFLLIGLQLRQIVRDPSFAAHYLWAGVAISAVTIAVRLVWVPLATYAPRLLSRNLRRRDPVRWQYVSVIAWSGMRGIVSLAAALALPLGISGRNEIVFITFCVIFATLVFQGLSLVPIVRWLGVDGAEDLKERETEVRVAALRAGISHLRRLERDFQSSEEQQVQGRIIAEYDYRIQHLERHGDGAAEMGAEVDIDHRLEHEALKAERVEIMRLREAGEIPDEIFRTIQYDLDLADSRIR